MTSTADCRLKRKKKIALKYFDWFTPQKKVTLTPEMRIIELMKYSGLGYKDLMDAPGWLVQVFEIRRREEANAAEYQQQKAKREQAKLKTNPRRHG